MHVRHIRTLICSTRCEEGGGYPSPRAPPPGALGPRRYGADPVTTRAYVTAIHDAFLQWTAAVAAAAVRLIPSGSREWGPAQTAWTQAAASFFRSTDPHPATPT